MCFGKFKSKESLLALQHYIIICNISCLLWFGESILIYNLLIAINITIKLIIIIVINIIFIVESICLCTKEA